MTEYCHLGNLKDYLNKKRNKRLSESEAKPLFRQLAGGLKFLWKNGLVHRDLKPENLLLSSGTSGEAGPPILKIGDFGIARPPDDGDTDMDLVSGSANGNRSRGIMHDKIGTLLYMAPEILTGAYDARCDLWSAGCIFYGMARVTFFGLLWYSFLCLQRCWLGTRHSDYHLHEKLCFKISSPINQNPYRCLLTLNQLYPHKDHPWFNPS